MPATETSSGRKPPWLKVRFPSSSNYFSVSNILKERNLHSICQSAKCPNITECWSNRTATFLILGDTCTRDCAFCAVKKGSPPPLATEEIQNIAEASSLMELKYVVLTSVTRDDLPDGGSFHFSRVIKHLKSRILDLRIEALIPDFNGRTTDLERIILARPDVLNHNIEVPESLYQKINRKTQNYARSLEVLRSAKQLGATTKSGLMVGLGESIEDIEQTLEDLRDAECDLLTIGQYLQPTPNNVPVVKYFRPDEFEVLRTKALELGFSDVEAGPLVRSSYKAHRMFQTISKEAA
ncbi:lipoyl synthase [Acidobacteriota bacterium]